MAGPGWTDLDRMGKLAYVWARLQQIWRDDPWLRFPGALVRRMGRQVTYRLWAATGQRLSVYGYHLGRRLGWPVARRTAAAAGFLWSPGEAEVIAARLRAEAPEYVAAMVGWADAVRGHRISLLGETLAFGPEVDWGSDPVSGKRWPLRYWGDLYPVTGGGADPKVPYELSRFHHGVALCLAYRLTGEAAYAAEFAAQFRHWWERNPYGFGVNWTCTMDVGIRAANLLLAYHLAGGAPALGARFTALFERCMLEHGRYIAANLENHAEHNSNHYLGDLAGLFYIGLLCPELPQAGRWLALAQAELEREMQRQVYPDGVDFEASTCYHRLVLEFFLYPVLLGRRSGRSFSTPYLQQLARMLAVTRALLKPNSRVPQIGDNDSGRLHCLAMRHPLDHGYLSDVGALLLGEPRLRRAGALDPEAAWLCGADAWQRWEQLAPAPAAEDAAFPDGGLYLLRRGDDLLCVAVCPNGQGGNGGHAHNDKLSFELVWDGQDLIVDPGTYLYTRDVTWRDRFRSTAYHNTLMLADEEQNRFRTGAAFTLEPDAEAVCTGWEPEQGRWCGYHTGYERLGVRHERCLEWAAGELRVTERLLPAGGAPPAAVAAAGHLHLAPGVTAELAGQDTVRLLRGGRELGCVRFLWPVALAVAAAWYSPGYGEKEPCQAIDFRWRATVPSELVWKIEKIDPEGSPIP